jgi:hypothetical protein
VAAGGPGGHPLTDITIWTRPVYSDGTDELIRKIGRLCSWRELNEWWDKEIGWQASLSLATQKAVARYSEVVERARQNGWEMPTDDSS